MVPVREFVRNTKGDKGMLELGQLEVRSVLSPPSFPSRSSRSTLRAGIPPPPPHTGRLLFPERRDERVACGRPHHAPAARYGGQVTTGRDGLD